MTKKVLLFFVFFVIAVFTGALFIHSFHKVVATQTPIVIYNTSKTPTRPEDLLQEDGEIDETPEEANLEVENASEKDDLTHPFSFVVVADAETYSTPSRQNDVFEHMLSLSASHKPAFALFTGDLLTFDFPDKNQLRNVKKLIEKYYDKYYIAVGKHDVECGAKCVDAWNKVFYDKDPVAGEEKILYHSFDHENTHFVLLSSDFPLKHSIDDNQLKWLDEDLSKTDKDHTIIAIHVPPVNFFKKSAKECHDMTCSEPQRTKLINILKKYHVDLVLSGHEHAFDHKVVDGIDFVLAGNSGNGKRYKDSTWEDSFSLVNVSKNHITLKGIHSNGEVIREIQIK
ncbi:MAG: metallophosphoesterase [Patescibacteria group bacterium]|nr:metallophosphoesterase [Patescibacteria group bacterium]